MTVRVSIKEGKASPLDEVIPNRAMVDILFTDVEELDPPIPERIALLRLAPMGEIIEGIGVRLDEDTFVVQEVVSL